MARTKGSVLHAASYTNHGGQSSVSGTVLKGPETPEIPILEFLTRELDGLYAELVSLTDWVNTWADKTVGSQIKELKPGQEKSLFSSDTPRARIDVLRDKVQQTYSELHLLKAAVYRINEL